MSLEELKTQLLEDMPAVFVRQQVRELTGGMIDGRTIANLDSLGQGPEGKVAMGSKKVGYLREPFVEWFVGRLTLRMQKASTLKDNLSKNEDIIDLPLCRSGCRGGQGGRS